MNKLRILHINTDLKFLHAITHYEDPNIHNDLLFIGDAKGDVRVKFQFSNTKSDLDKIITLANNYDAVILLDLEQAKSYIANRLRKDISVFWFFFGYELYGKILNITLSELTKRIIQKETFRKGGLLKLGPFSKAYSLWRQKEFSRAIKRIDYFLCLCQEEYEFLSHYFKLPEFIQRPYVIESSLVYNEKLGNKLMIGNSRSVFNNHIDILNMLREAPEIEKYAFLNYGPEGQYYDAVMSKGNELGNFKPITSFLNKIEFEKVYNVSDAFVMNGYRQMAVGNIITAIRHGVKLYINYKNPFYHFLIKNGFLVSEINDLDNDLRNKHITLNEPEMEQNIRALVNLSKKYSQNDFVGRIEDCM